MARIAGCTLPFLLAGLAAAGAAERPLVAVVFGEHSYRSAPQGEGRGVRTFMDILCRALDSAGVPYAKLKDSDVEAGRLAGYRAAVFPYSFKWPAAEVEAIERYVEGGGKVVGFYTWPKRLRELVGVQETGWSGDRQPRNYFAAIRLRQGLVPGLPARVRQDSWNIHRIEPASPDAQVLGEWLDPEGEPIGEPAIVLSPRGAFMGHVLTGADLEAKGRMLLALLGHLVPEVWEGASERAIASAPRVGPLGGFGELEARIAEARVSWWKRWRARRHLARARRRLGEARERRQAGEHAAAIEAGRTARGEAAEAFALSSAERRREFRATWIHTAYGVRDWGWRRSIRHLRRHGFNAVIPNMLWAGVAHYPSEVLPVAEQVAERGDQIAECLRWCRRYGVELHVWKVNYNLSHAPQDFVARLREAGRLQRRRDGSEIKWLCPSHPENFALERDSMLEVVRRYRVHGIHFDYIRYPGAHACFCEGCRERFEQAAGVEVATWPDDVLRGPLKARFAAWRQDQITRLVAAVATEARRIRPGVMVSAAVFNNWEAHRFAVGQDWRLWLQKGYLDFVCPMDYTPDADRLEELVARQVEWVEGMAPLYVGIGAWRIEDAPGLLDQLERARRVGADGFVCFHYNDLEFAQRRLPALARSHTAHPTPPPHPAPGVSFDFPPGLEELAGLAYGGDSVVTVPVSLAARGNYRHPVQRATGRVWLETTAGERVRRFRRVRGDGAPLAVTFQLEPGRYRLVVRGSVAFGWLSWRSYVVRSRPFEVVSRDAVAAARKRAEPPVFGGRGLRVGVASGGYGSEALLAVLAAAPGIEAVTLHSLEPAFLEACQVVVFPQPRQPGATTGATVAALRKFVAAGGGLLATHDAPGYRSHPVLLPSVCSGGVARVEGSRWRPAARHPVVQGLAAGEAVPHGYYDYIALAAGPRGTAVAEGLGGEGGRPVVVCGPHGEGRYVACGLALGIDREDREREPQGAERRLLLDAVRWLAGR
ncbi:MAG: family 10 glycosylhydrolase [Candidatus Brocadiia bacterium]